MADVNYFEDVEIGSVRESGTYCVVREEVIDFATRYDPQEFHLSDEAAARSPFGRIAASGWNTAAIVMRLFVDCPGNEPEAGASGIGADELRWLKPVYPGDTLHLRIEAIRKERSRSKPQFGTVWQHITALNQDGEAVMTVTLIGLVKLRNPES